MGFLWLIERVQCTELCFHCIRAAASAARIANMTDSETVDECLDKEISWLNRKRKLEEDALNEKYEKKIKRLKETADRVQKEAAERGWSPSKHWSDDAELSIAYHYMEQRFEELCRRSNDHFIVLWEEVTIEDCFKDLLRKYSKKEAKDRLYFYKSNVLVKFGVTVTSSSYERFDPHSDNIVNYYIQQRSLPCFDAPLPAHFEADKKPLEDEYVMSSRWQSQNKCFEGEMPGKKSLFIMPIFCLFKNFMNEDYNYDFGEEDVYFDATYDCYTAVCKQPAIVVSTRPTCKLDEYSL